MNKHWGFLPTQLMLSCRGWPPLMCNDAGGSGPWPRHHYNGSSLTSSLLLRTRERHSNESMKTLREEKCQVIWHISAFIGFPGQIVVWIRWMNIWICYSWIMDVRHCGFWCVTGLIIRSVSHHPRLIAEMHSEQESVIVSTNNYIALIASVNQ